MDSDTSINVPVKVRTHELQQVHDFIPEATDRLRDVDTEHTQKRADELGRIYTEYVEGVTATYPKDQAFAAYVSMPSDDWQLVLSAFRRLRKDEGLRVEWLQTKLVKRLRERLSEMED